jgi:hypothetical protein
MKRRTAVLTVELERAALRELRQWFLDLSHSHFEDRLRPVVLCFSDGKVELGRWRRDVRTIELSRTLLRDHSWCALVEVLKHEMAHQYVDEVLGFADEAVHGPRFRKVCAERGIDARAEGLPRIGPSAAERHVLDRVGKLLALAESSNVHEAQSAMSAAQRLMLKYNLKTSHDVESRPYTHRVLGKATGRVEENQRILAMILAEYFFVETIWVPVWRPLEGRRGSVLEVSGTQENLELAEYVFDFLNRAAERLWREHKRAEGIAGNMHRRAYIAGVMSGFEEKLKKERTRNHQRGLVWVGDAGLDAYWRKRHPRVRWSRYGARSRPEEYGHGKRAGQRLVLSRGMGKGPSERIRQLAAGD